MKNIYKNGIIEINKRKFIKIIKVIPINYNLKSDLEKTSILNSYKILLKTCNFDIQILIQSNKEDLSNHIFKIKKNIQKEKNKYLKEISENYINFIKKLNNSRNSASKDFYLIFSNDEVEKFNSFEIIENNLNDKYLKIKECLLRCGNEVIEINTNEEVINILNNLFNTRKYLEKGD